MTQLHTEKNKAIIKLDKNNHKWLKNKKLQKLLSVLEENSGEARIVGGAIRDALIGEQVRDIDIATTKTPDEIIKIAHHNGFKTKPTGIEHGTISVITGKKCFQVTTLRADIETDGRHAKIQHIKNWIPDAKRRDFTINALYCDKNGCVFEPIAGSYDDILNKKVNFIGDPDARIKEDYLRILRFFRFRARFNDNHPDPAALKACQNNKQGLKKLSRERIRAEFSMLLNAQYPIEPLNEMKKYHIFLDHIEPVHLAHFKSLCQIEKYFLNCHDHNQNEKWIVKLITLSDADISALIRYIALNNKEIKMIQNLRKIHSISLRDISENYKKYLCIYEKNTLQNHLIIQWARQKISPNSTQNRKYHALLQKIKKYPTPIFPLNGGDLKNIGITTGPEMGRILKSLKHYWSENEGKPDKKNLLKYAKNITNPSNQK